MNLQSYGLTGRKIRPDYVGIINANKTSLSKKKSLADEERYRNQSLALIDEEIAQNERAQKENEQLQRDILEQNKKSSEKATLVGVGQLGTQAYLGNRTDKKLKEIVSSGGGSEKTTGTITPEATPEKYDMAAIDTPDIGKTAIDTTKNPSIIDSIKSGFKENWGSILSSSLVGGTVGAELGEKYVPIGGKKEKRIIGGGLTSGALSYLSTGDPWSAGLSLVFGAAGGGLF